MESKSKKRKQKISTRLLEFIYFGQFVIIPTTIGQMADVIGHEKWVSCPELICNTHFKELSFLNKAKNSFAKFITLCIWQFEMCLKH